MIRKALLPIVLLGFLTSAGLAQATKHALIFAIGNYPAKNGWPIISSLSDIPYVTSMLENQGFANHIAVYKDSQVTPAGIEEAISKLTVKKGDIVVIHFSTHGSQIEDDNRDEMDGLDESIVTYNAVAPDPFGHTVDFSKTQKDYFRDDRLGILIENLRKALGKEGDVAVFLDFCNSGSATRGFPVRGGKPALVSSTFDSKKFLGRDSSMYFTEKTNYSGSTDDRSSYVVFSAARAEEPAREVRDDTNRFMGSLTYSLHKAIQRSNTTFTYRNLFSQVQAVMNDIVPGQHPVLEGSNSDRLLFGGKFIRQQPFVEIETIQGKKLTLLAGKMNGLDKGTRIFVYDANTINPKNSTPLDSGEITTSDIFRSVATLTNGLKFAQASLGRVFFRDPSFSIEPITMTLSGYNTAEEKTINENLKQLSALKLGKGGELLLIKGSSTDTLLINSTQNVFSVIPSAVRDKNALVEKLKAYVQYKFLQRLDIRDSTIKLEVKLIPVKNGKPDKNFLMKPLLGIQQFSVGDTFMLQVSNNGPDPLYFNILDLQPDGVINAVVPNRPQRIYPSDLKLAGNSSRLLDKYILPVAPPTGTEIYKIFASLDEIDVEIIAASRGQNARGNFGDLEAIVKESFDIATRGTPGKSLRTANGTCYNLIFEIK